jgi:protein-tyrosine kinase
MSRVDRALRAWEGGRPQGPATDDTQRANNGSIEAFTLDQYLREGPAVAEPKPVAAEAPTVVEAPKVGSPRSSMDEEPARRNAKYDPDVEARLVTGGSGSVPLEQYRRLAAILHDAQLQQGLKTLMLTSALPNEGKTLTTVNLGLTLSESYARRVLIIDADLRWPSVHTTFDIANDRGLSEALQGQQFDLPIQQLSPRLAVLTAGRPGRTPLAGLTSVRMATLIDECAKHFDWVLIDTPPVGLLPDAQLLARLTRAVLLVIAAGVTPTAAVERAVAELGADCIIGTVLNRVDERQIPQANYYYTHYGTTSDDRR